LAGKDGAYVSPLVRKLASDLGVDLSNVVGSGVGGRIRREDVEGAMPVPAPGPAPDPAPVPATPSSFSPPDEAARKLALLRTATSETPPKVADVTAQATGSTSVALLDVTELTPTTGAAQPGPPLNTEPRLVHTVINALKTHPKFNAGLGHGPPTYSQQQNIGLMVDTPSGPAVAVVPDAGSQPIEELTRAIGQIAARAEAGTLQKEDLQGATFTMTSSGGPDVLLNLPQIQTPQVAVLSVGAISQRPVVMGQAIAIRSMAYLALSFDSRLLTATEAAQFLSAIKRQIEVPNF